MRSRRRKAFLAAFDLGYEHGKAKSSCTGKKLAYQLLPDGCRRGDARELRKAYSAGIWARFADELDQKDMEGQRG